MPGASAKPLELYWTVNAKDDFAYWQRHNKPIAAKIEKLIADTLLNPFSGLGKPEPLRFDLSGAWSRRITSEHRLTYRVEAGVLFIVKCRFHYKKKTKK